MNNNTEKKKIKVCSVKDCGKKHHAKGYCKAHYSRWKRHGNPLAIVYERGKYTVCKVDGCNDKHYGNGYCIKHNARFKAHGDPLTLLKDPERTCSVEG